VWKKKNKVQQISALLTFYCCIIILTYITHIFLHLDTAHVQRTQDCALLITAPSLVLWFNKHRFTFTNTITNLLLFLSRLNPSSANKSQTTLSHTQQNDDHQLTATYDHHLLCPACKKCSNRGIYKAPADPVAQGPPKHTLYEHFLWVVLDWVPFIWQKTEFWFPTMASGGKVANNYRGGPNKMGQVAQSV
jgi:hypothetical protein